MVSKKTDKPTAKGMVSAAAALAAAAMVIRPFVPYELRSYVINQLRNFVTAAITNEMVVVVEEFEGSDKNQLFKAVETYMPTLVRPSNTRIRAALPIKDKKISVSVEPEEELFDEFRGIKLSWRMVCKRIPAISRRVLRPDDSGGDQFLYELRFHKKHRSRVLDEYFPYVVETSKAAENDRKSLKLFSNESSFYAGYGKPWKCVNLDHPATFDTLAMDTDLKKMVMNDLDQFVARKEVYRRMGKAWKRGYLLFGPPGTGKSSLIAAMANYLKFDVYDLELTSVRSNRELRKLLVATANRSILVVEDIDCSAHLTERRSAESSQGTVKSGSDDRTITLSGLLNFNDGLWSSCGDERIFVFTTNHVEKLDPALLRPGRMDVHIHMSYCTPSGFRLLASNYLGTHENPLLLNVEREVANARVTPAEIGEQLLKHGEPEMAMQALIQFLDEKRKMNHQQDELPDST